MARLAGPPLPRGIGPMPGLARVGTVEIDCLAEDDRWTEAGLPALADRAGAATLAELGLDGAFEADLLGCDDTRIADLNAAFRGKPTPTNVLSWPSENRGPDAAGERPAAPDPEDPELGDIAIAYETCVREATEADVPFADHVVHLLVHALLHLLGYDHARDADATLMEATEVAILARLGLPDPYAR